MNTNIPQHQYRESKHSTNLTAMEAPTARCRIPQPRQRQPLFSYSYNASCGNKKFHSPLEDSDTVRSQSIPICQTALRRTASELKLSEDEATADFHDYIFFSRLLEGIAKQQEQETVSSKFLRESDECLAHIIGTRNGSVDNLSSPISSTTNDLLYLPSRSEETKKDDEGIFLMDM
jgi:hypothetical protein